MNKRTVPTTIAAVAAAITTLAIGSAAQASTEPPIPPIDQIGAQFVTEEGATAVACSQFNADVICYGLVEGQIVAGVFADGAFSPYVAPATAAAPTTAPVTTVATATGGVQDTEGAQEFANIIAEGLEPDLLSICPMVQSSPSQVRDMMTEVLLENQDIIDKAAEFNVPLADFVDMIVVAYGNRLVRDCA